MDAHLIALAGFLEAGEPAALFRHPDDDWIARLFRNRTAEQRKRFMEIIKVVIGQQEAA